MDFIGFKKVKPYNSYAGVDLMPFIQWLTAKPDEKK
jgi:hypothetical protein